MNSMTATLDNKRINVYIEGRRRKTFVGTLESKQDGMKFVFCYTKKYLQADNSIPLGPDIPLSKIKHESVGKLFESFIDRIPSKRNPAYKDYCRQEEISPEETNPIILLGTIGKRGPSSFVFESIYDYSYDIRKNLLHFKNQTGISLQDIATAFSLNYVTVQRIQAGKSKDVNTIRLIRIFLEYPKCLSDQLELTRHKLHHKVVSSIADYAEKDYERDQDGSI